MIERFSDRFFFNECATKQEVEMKLQMLLAEKFFGCSIDDLTPDQFNYLQEVCETYRAAAIQAWQSRTPLGQAIIAELYSLYEELAAS